MGLLDGRGSSVPCGCGAALCPGSRGKQTPEVHQAEHCQRDEEGDPSLQLSTGETCLSCWVPSTRDLDIVELVHGH